MSRRVARRDRIRVGCAEKRGAQQEDLRQHVARGLERVAESLGRGTRHAPLTNDGNRSIDALAFAIKYAHMRYIDDLPGIFRRDSGKRLPSVFHGLNGFLPLVIRVV